MSENNNTEAMLKQLMDMVAKQNDEIAKLKEINGGERVGNHNHTPSPVINIKGKDIKPFPVTNKDENPFEKSAEIIKNEEDIRKQIELEYKSKELINNFDNKYSNYLSKEDLTIVNSSNADEKHKAVEKFTRIFKNENNLDLIPTMLKNEVKQIMELNDTEKAKFNDISKIDTILSTFSEIKDKVDLSNSRFLGNSNVPKKETIAESKWKEAIAKANGITI